MTGIEIWWVTLGVLGSLRGSRLTKSRKLRVAAKTTASTIRGSPCADWIIRLRLPRAACRTITAVSHVARSCWLTILPGNATCILSFNAADAALGRNRHVDASHFAELQEAQSATHVRR